MSFDQLVRWKLEHGDAECRIETETRTYSGAQISICWIVCFSGDIIYRRVPIGPSIAEESLKILQDPLLSLHYLTAHDELPVVA
jgi:hypothetical protein